MKKSIGFVLLAALFITACSEQQGQDAGDRENKQGTSKIERKILPAQYTRGQQLFQKNCAVCHGRHAEGAANWQKTDSEGKYPPPPLNGTAHSWHHPYSVLVMTIREGTGQLGGNMPAWKDRLSEQDIADILVWIQAQWPDEIYAAWHENNQQSLKNR